ncbi:YcxB family protein [Parabacteroides sp. FAFU027]|uniref:YcxB family protein n=1 Tax=Parabacteroides sp. FAFU027 TaxID=2922715 RepID=UPI001FB036A5|nr:YcxB family protein [Parabacteroides sp. FAFU027]
MEIQFQNALSDYKSFYRLHYTNELRKRIAVAFVFPLVIGYSFAGQSFDWTRFISTAILAEVLYIGFFYFTPYLISVYRINKAILKDPRYLERKRLWISDEGISFETATRNETMRWESLVSAESNGEYVSLTLADKRFYLIPVKAFPSESDLINFLGVAQSEIIKVRGSMKLPNDATKQRPPYILGISCIIPLIGAFIGILFVVLGITKYKDKWFTMIGVLGIVFTIVLYVFLVPGIWNTKDMDRQKAELAQSSLNSLVKEIEFYKLQHGKYPQKLELLDSYEIYDPLMTEKNKNSTFNYFVEGDKYNLFSSGIDRIANTKDDLYPEVTVTDSSKIGLIRRNE